MCSRMQDGIEERHYRSARELWHALSPTEELFPSPREIVFRGHGDASWSLAPAILRKDSHNRSFSINREASGKVFLEARLLHQFAEHCDRVGVRLPGDSIALRKGALNPNDQPCLIRPTRWPDEDLFEVMAFAQHHGVPTRLLDWTRNPQAAMYFAAAGALSLQDSWADQSQLAVWALNIESIGLFREILTVVKTPGSVSPHLAAQAGLFTVQNLREGSELVGLELEEKLWRGGKCPLLKLTLPVSESAELLDLCEKVGVSASSLFPGADGAARATKDSVNAWTAYERAKG